MKFRKSYLWALIILIAIGGWLASGILMRASVDPADPLADPIKDKPGTTPIEVRAVELTASDRRHQLTVRGHTEAERRVAVRAETVGRVTDAPQGKGTLAAEGDLLCRLDIADREARLEQARAAVAQAELDYQAAEKLKKKGFTAAIDEASRKARLDAARAAMTQAEIEIERTRILAPFSGVIEDQNARVGTYLGIGDPCATLVDLDPILVVGSVSERNIGKLSVGMAGTARLVTGEEVGGRIRYVAPSADRATRTFRVEFEAGNPRHTLRDGVTAELLIPLPPISAHELSHAALTLDDNGIVGVRTVDEAGKVDFMAVDIIADTTDSVWVSGLPEKVTVITLGQEYVRPGQIVRPIVQNRAAGR